MSETFYYEPLTQIMSAPYDGQVMPAAYLAQSRENLMALFTGESFRLSQSVAQTTGYAFLWDTVDWATPNVDVSMHITGISPGFVRIPLGLWLVGMDAQGTWGSYREMRGGAFLSLTSGGGDWKETQTGATAGLIYANQALQPIGWLSDGTTITTTVATYHPYFWGVQLRDP